MDYTILLRLLFSEDETARIRCYVATKYLGYRIYQIEPCPANSSSYLVDEHPRWLENSAQTVP
jgi:hypothetical protein